ncbi:FCD domain-containing protein [Solimonas sp. K1W22B-7]|uniref:FCD domain-containing protein n=1 Tax=Solimonas sp. K1W22B-7 TaxID=2303331 RepID=UPI001F09520C|nr:FCD domain-containing protein [Solimonas sp. K1W22B-7]
MDSKCQRYSKSGGRRHRAIADAAHNPIFSYLLMSLLKLLYEHVQLSIAGLTPDTQTARQLRAQHREVMEAILGGDPPRAAAAAGQHMYFVRVRLNDLELRQGRRDLRPPQPPRN